MAIADRPNLVSVNFDGSLIAVSINPKGGDRNTASVDSVRDGQLKQPAYPTVDPIPAGQQLVIGE